MKKLTALVAFCVLVLPLVGCSTVQGIGKDLTKASEATERAISK